MLSLLEDFYDKNDLAKIYEKTYIEINTIFVQVFLEL